MSPATKGGKRGGEKGDRNAHACNESACSDYQKQGRRENRGDRKGVGGKWLEGAGHPPGRPVADVFWPAALPGCIIIMQHAAVDMECLRFVAKTKRCLTPERVLASTSPISPHLGNGKGAAR